MSNKKKLKKFKAKYQCVKCTYTWQQVPEIIPCPVCANKYIKWLNYDQTYGTLSSEQLKELSND